MTNHQKNVSNGGENLALVLLILASVAFISIFFGIFPSTRPFLMETETKDSSNFENKTDIKHDAASSAVRDVLLAIHFTIVSTTDPGFNKSS